MKREKQNIKYNGPDGNIGLITTLFLAAKPVNMHDPLEVTGKIMWIIASCFAIAWWISRFIDRHRKKNGR